MIAATSAVCGLNQRLPSDVELTPPENATIVAAIAKTARTEGRRALPSFFTPVTLNESAMTQFISGGLRRNGLPPTYGTSQFPVSNIVTAGKMRLPSSPFNSVEPSPGKYITAHSASRISEAFSRFIRGREKAKSRGMRIFFGLG